MGTQVGREHQRLGRNNQDGLAVMATGDLMVAVVTDGCSSGRFSEVGARMGAAWLAGYLHRHARSAACTHDVQAFAWQTSRALGRQIELWARDIASGELLPSIVGDYFLFTFVAAVRRDQRLWIFGLGDGVLGVDGDLITKDAGADNAPAYAGYLALPALVDRDLEPWAAHASASWRTALIGTDGVGEVPDEARAWQQQPSYRRHPLALQRRLRVLSEREHRLTDDTTAILIHRRPS